MTPSEQKAAAKRAKELGVRSGIAELGVQDTRPGGVPHYFGPYGNWAFSPLPRGPIATVTAMSPGSGYTAPVVTIGDAYLPATAFTAANVSAILGGGVIAGLTIDLSGSGYNNPLVSITDPTGTGADVSVSINPATGAIVGFTIHSGGSGYTAPVVTITDASTSAAEEARSLHAAPELALRPLLETIPSSASRSPKEAVAILPPLSPSRMLRAQAPRPMR